MAYNDRSLERSFKFVKLSFNEEEAIRLERLLATKRGHPAAIIREMVLREADEALHCEADSVASFPTKQRAEKFLSAA